MVKGREEEMEYEGYRSEKVAGLMRKGQKQ